MALRSVADPVTTRSGIAIKAATLLQHPRKRRWIAVGADTVAIFAAIGASAILSATVRSSGDVMVMVFMGLGTTLAGLISQNAYASSWKYFGFEDALTVSKGVSLGTASLVAIALASRLMAGGPNFDVNFFAEEFLLSMALLLGSRAAARWTIGYSTTSHLAKRRRVLIVGAGSAGERVIRLLQSAEGMAYEPLGFIDDDPMKQGVRMHGVPVIGARYELEHICDRLGPEEIWIAMPSVDSEIIRETIGIAQRSKCGAVKILPGLGTILRGPVQLSDVRLVRTEDLLGREVVKVDTKAIANVFAGSRVLITGAAGSIGSELSRQVARFEPRALLLLDQDETGLFNIHGELHNSYGNLRCEPVVADVSDERRISQVFRVFRPEIVIHAAAYKHVPMMELHPSEAVKTNIFGTRVIANTAVKCGTERFVLISTDKSVNPTSIMGASKRAAELIVQDCNRQTAKGSFISVRFGNVLGSRGSVIPTFQGQIAKGGPVTVTHPEMKRYFMTIEEAVLLVLQAATIGQGGQVLVLDMGQPVKIADLARQLIRLNGLIPDQDIGIEYTGIRPGEKLFEDLLSAEEGTDATTHDRVFVARGKGLPTARELASRLTHLEFAALNEEGTAIQQELQELVPTYRPKIPEPAGLSVPVPPRSGKALSAARS